MTVSKRLLWWLTYGIAATLIFPIAYTLEGTAVPGYSAMRQTISSLSHTALGSVQNANFIVLGLVEFWLAYVFAQILRGGPGCRWYPVARIVEGAGLVALGFFSWDPWHTVSMVVCIVGMDIGLFIMAWRLSKEPGWRGWALFTLICALWPNLIMPLFGVSEAPGGALSGYTGLLERLGTNADTIWAIVLLFPLWRRAASDSPVRPVPSDMAPAR